jgi:hypothetical protein
MARCGRHGETVNDGVISTPPQITTAAHLPSPSSFESNPIIGTHVCCDFEHYNGWIDVLSIDIISLSFSHFRTLVDLFVPAVLLSRIAIARRMSVLKFKQPDMHAPCFLRVIKVSDFV